MSRRLTLFATLLVVFALAGGAMAQVPQSDCFLGVFADSEGTVNVLEPTEGVPFNIYVVMQLEGLFNAVAYDLLVPRFGEDIFLIGETFGPAARGINIPTPGGYNIGLGECAIGFGGVPILVATHTLLIPFETFGARSISVGPNKDWDQDAPIFAVCTGQVYPCTINDNLLLTSPIDTESTSFGAVKSLFRN
jgi:hypothetical protein